MRAWKWRRRHTLVGVHCVFDDDVRHRVSGDDFQRVGME